MCYPAELISNHCECVDLFLPSYLSITILCVCLILQFDTTLPVWWGSKIPEHVLPLKCNTRTILSIKIKIKKNPHTHTASAVMII